ncbi:CBS domain-containing protein [Reyranella soli]|uniref:CBS domain-containing protein n=1 Tax=Reyranella soli TaxID=1230389 RepID=A0A512NPF4_9HYPH|nr:CBS domain-containing protein [Reyranella soli]GEP60823.1 CBS domain-containing protein [Reyranella soli]
MRAGDVMTRDVVTVRPDAMIREAAQMMDDLNVGALPVCDGRRLVGIITDRDIVVRSTADGMRPDATPVHVVMTGEVCWCVEDDPVEKIEGEMARRQIRRMPVVDQDKRLVGMIALGDLATDRAPGAGDALRRISEPSEPDRSRRASRQGDGDAPWPAYGDGGRGPRQ